MFPPTHRELFGEVRRKGCLVSPFAVGTPSLRENFLRRNSVVAALSMALVLIEGPEKSGALMTASQTLNMGRELFVVPGPIHLN